MAKQKEAAIHKHLRRVEKKPDAKELARVLAEEHVDHDGNKHPPSLAYQDALMAVIVDLSERLAKLEEA